MKLFDTRFVVFVGFQQCGHDRAGIYQQLGGQEPPNPSKYFGFVLRSRDVTLAERRGYKWAATTANLKADVYTLFWHDGSIKHRLYDKTEDWDKLTERVKGLFANWPATGI